MIFFLNIFQWTCPIDITVYQQTEINLISLCRFFQCSMTYLIHISFTNVNHHALQLLHRLKHNSINRLTLIVSEEKKKVRFYYFYRLFIMKISANICKYNMDLFLHEIIMRNLFKIKPKSVLFIFMGYMLHFFICSWAFVLYFCS